LIAQGALVNVLARSPIALARITRIARSPASLAGITCSILELITLGRLGSGVLALVAKPVVEPAQHPSVLLGGLTTLGEGDDVVALAPVRGHLTAGIATAEVTDLDSSTSRTGEQSCFGAHLGSQRRSEHHVFDERLVKVGNKLNRIDNRA